MPSVSGRELSVWLSENSIPGNTHVDAKMWIDRGGTFPVIQWDVPLKMGLSCFGVSLFGGFKRKPRAKPFGGGSPKKHTHTHTNGTVN